MFLGPPPRSPHAEVTDELERVRATPPQQVASEITRTYPSGIPQVGQRFVDDPAGTLDELVEQMRTFWDTALAPWWTRISALLESEIASRARRLVAVGGRAAFTDLHPTVWWHQGVLHVHPTRKAPADVDLAGRGLLLVPAVFTWPNVWPRTDPPWDPALVYPPPGIADLWTPDGHRHDALASLLGRRRAQVLVELDRPASTLELARRLGVSPGSVSDHLTTLRRAGLVTPGGARADGSSTPAPPPATTSARRSSDGRAVLQPARSQATHGALQLPCPPTVVGVDRDALGQLACVAIPPQLLQADPGVACL